MLLIKEWGNSYITAQNKCYCPTLHHHKKEGPETLLIGCLVQHSSLILSPRVYLMREIVFSFRFSLAQGEYKQGKNNCANLI
jgi:hypothetical protein